MACRIILPSGLALRPDTAVRIGHSAEAEVTSHPVENGASIADHVVIKPNSVTLDTRWTPRPIDASYLPAGADRPTQAFDLLSAALQSALRLRIEVDDETYWPAILTAVRMDRGFEDGDGRTIQVEATQVQVVSGQTVASPALASKLKGTGKTTKKTVIPLTASTAILAGVEAVRGDWMGALGILGQ